MQIVVNFEKSHLLFHFLQGMYYWKLSYLLVHHVSPPLECKFCLSGDLICPDHCCSPRT